MVALDQTKCPHEKLLYNLRCGSVGNLLPPGQLARALFHVLLIVTAISSAWVDGSETQHEDRLKNGKITPPPPPK